MHSTKMFSSGRRALAYIAILAFVSPVWGVVGRVSFDDDAEWLQRLADKNPNVRKDALLEMRSPQVYEHFNAVLPRIFVALKDEDASVRLIGHGILYYVMAEAAEKSPDAYRSAMQSIATSAQLIVEGASDKDPRVREVALMNLGLFVPSSSEISQLAVHCMKDTSYKVRGRAVELAMKTGPLTPEVVPSLIEAVHDENEVVRQRAVRALGALKLAEAVRPLLDVADDQKNALRRDALMALMQMGPAANEALPTLGRLSKTDPDEKVRELAQAALRRIGGSDDEKRQNQPPTE